MTREEQIRQFNQRLRNKVIVDELKQVKALQRQSAAAGIPLSRKEARAALQEQKDAEVQRAKQIHDAVAKAVPQFLKEQSDRGGNVKPLPDSGIPPPKPVSDNALVVPRIYRDDDDGDFYDFVIFTNAGELKVTGLLGDGVYNDP